MAFAVSKGYLRSLVLVVASYAFCSYAGWGAVGALGAVTLVTFAAGRAFVVRRTPALLWTAVVGVLSPLMLFKYRAFAGSLVGASAASQAEIPIGLSFYSLQAVSYLVDVYYGRAAATGSLSHFALYMSFFPKLLAGPIERFQNLGHQLRNLHGPATTDVYLGMKTALWGYACKLLVADKMAGVAQSVLDQPDVHSRVSILLAIYAFSARMYFDFYGYTCIAIGVARTFGIRLSENFDDPYLSTSVRDFWRRWHITLMNWLRDYVYIPLGGSRHGVLRRLLAILVVFTVSALWHGGSTAFLLWGLVHAGAVVATVAWAQTLGTGAAGIAGHRWLAAVARTASIVLTFTFVSIAWLPFSVGDLHAVGTVLRHLLETEPATPLLSPIFYRTDVLFFVVLLVTAFALDSLGIIDSVVRRVPTTRAEVAGELIAVNVMCVLIVLVGDLGSQTFIYFQF